MPNNYYERLSEMNPGELADGLALEQEFDAISRGFAKLPVPHRDGNGFEGPTRVGDPVEKTDAVNLGTLEKLNLPIYRKKITTEDWNTITDAGIYDVVSASGANKAPGYAYGILNVFKFNGVVTQQFTPDKKGVLIKRVCENISTSSWGAWDIAYSTSMGSAGFRNKIINGDFRINQRAYQSGAATSPGQYTLDRWKVSGAQGVSFSISNGKTVVTIPSGQTLKQVIESSNIPAGDYVLSWGGTAQGRIDDGAYGQSGSVVITTNGTSNVSVEFSSGTVENVQLEQGATPTPYENKPIQLELISCRRYFRPTCLCNAINHDNVWVSFNFPLVSDMRATPTIVTGQVYNGASGATMLTPGWAPNVFSQDGSGYVNISSAPNKPGVSGWVVVVIYSFNAEL